MRIWLVIVALLVLAVGGTLELAPVNAQAASPVIGQTQGASTGTLVLRNAVAQTPKLARTHAGVAAQAVLTGTAGLENTFVTIRPAASGGGVQTLALTLNDDSSAQLVTNFHNGEPPIVEVGTWEESDGSLVLTLTGREDDPYDAPVVVTFEQADDTLQSVANVDTEARYGADGLRLRQASSVASDLDRALFTLDLVSGFALDPTFISLNGGGAIDARVLGGACTGFVHLQPVATVNWSGEADLLRAFFVSDSDPTLVIATPDGTVLCNDDAHPLLLDPSVQVTDPVTGTYRIWVGSAEPNQLVPGVLVLTTRPDMNLGTFDLGGLIKRPLIPVLADDASAAGRAEIVAAIEAKLADAPLLTPDSETITAEITAEGTVPLFQLNLNNPQCSGLVAPAPDFVFRWEGDAAQLQVFFEGDADATLLVFGAAGEVRACNDDVDPATNINPLVVVQQPQEGVYGVWVGRLSATQPVTGTLTITLAEDAAPAVLAPVVEE